MSSDGTNAKRQQDAYSRFEKLGLFEADDAEDGRSVKEAIVDPRPPATPQERLAAITDAANRILQFYGLCVMEMGISRVDVIAAIELATLTAFNDPNSKLTVEQINKARDVAYRIYTQE